MSAIALTNAAEASAAPLNKKDRILFLDALRGIALLGILVMNSMAQGQAYFFYSNLNLDQPIKGANFYAWLVEMGVFEGTMRGLFSILFGAGTVLLINRLEKSRSHIDAADIYYRRILWLLFFGLINAFVFLWVGDILYSYALCGLLLFPFRNLTPRTLLIAAFVMLAFGCYRETAFLYDHKETISKGMQAEALQAQHKKLDKKQTADLEKWHTYRDKNDSKGMMKAAKEETEAVQSASYPELFVHFRDQNVDVQSRGFYNFWWDMMMFFFIGMAVYKSGFLTGNSPNGLYITLAIVGIGAGLIINYFELRLAYRARFNYVIINQANFLEFYQIRRLFQTIGYLSALILLYKVVPLRKVFHLFSPVGQMAFTNYLSQSIFAAIIFYGFGLFAKLQRYEIYYVVGAIWAFQLIFSTIWLRYFMFGPFEWVWRSLTYKKFQPFKRMKDEGATGTTTAAVGAL